MIFKMYSRIWLVVLGLILIYQDCLASEQKKNALVLAGAVSRLPASSKGGSNGQYSDASSLYDETRPHSAIHVCAASIMKHMVKANNDVEFDFFIHTWSFELETQFRALYDFKMAEFEDNRIYEPRISALYPQFKWSELSYTISAQSAIQLMLKYEKRNKFTYDRILLVRPDIFISKDLILNKLPRSPQKMYCNNHGKAAGDFHFVMEHNHAVRLSTVLPLQQNSSIAPHIVGGHNRMNLFAAKEMDTVMSNDNQIDPGADEEVYRKVVWHLMLCNARDWWRNHMAVNYGMTEEDWGKYEELSKTSRPCVAHDPALLLHYCCKGETCVSLGEPGSENCGRRIA
mmetsp:Transcript_46866/g.60235  ORF Transcript_46866/g.60235 Transcript_46866/m.60235 type:complete len:343 (-) Transcript_46866:251-1279(-)